MKRSKRKRLHNLKKKGKYNHKGYVIVTYPKHPRAWKGSGFVYLHRLIMENHLGRILEPWEHVHHKDGDPKNNTLRNLGVTTNAEHGRTHRPKQLKPKQCDLCKKTFQPRSNKSKYCCIKCSQKAIRKVTRPSKEKLYALVWSVPSEKVAAKYNVSGRAIGKWCEMYGIKKPPRGYWTKVKAGFRGVV
jgi:hypothetical protein